MPHREFPGKEPTPHVHSLVDPQNSLLANIYERFDKSFKRMTAQYDSDEDYDLQVVKGTLFKDYEAQLKSNAAAWACNVVVTDKNIDQVKVALLGNIYKHQEGDLECLAVRFKLLPPYYLDEKCHGEAADKFFEQIVEDRGIKRDNPQAKLSWWFVDEVELNYVSSIEKKKASTKKKPKKVKSATSPNFNEESKKDDEKSEKEGSEGEEDPSNSKTQPNTNMKGSCTNQDGTLAAGDDEQGTHQ